MSDTHIHIENMTVNVTGELDAETIQRIVEEVVSKLEAAIREAIAAEQAAR